MGIGRGDVVAIIGPRSFGLIGTMLGVLMSGGAFLTIDPKLPAQRELRVMLREARAKLACLIGQPADSDRQLAADETLPVLRADLELASLAGTARSSDCAWSLPTIHGDDPAYVFFTSGSTGQPKAILGCHKGLSHFLHWQRDTFAIGKEDRVSQLIGLTFDPLLRDVFLPLTSGAQLCVPTESDLLDTIGWMKRENITVVHTTPTVMQSWLPEVDEQVELQFLRWLFISGEPLNDVLIGKWRRKILGPRNWSTCTDRPKRPWPAVSTRSRERLRRESNRSGRRCRKARRWCSMPQVCCAGLARPARSYCARLTARLAI